ncbi:PRD domain-containing protein [Bacillus cereus group sp. BfR-BA-01538]|uniref:BglG family transcription antiterminator n=1 Tax=Bacillus cereus group sp. BfR-BA-01538 TaxID=2920373 RepID=UPI001F58FD45
MQNIEFQVYLDKDIIRQERLLHILNQEDKWYQLDELSLNLNWAKNTISKDILILNDCLPKGWVILCGKGQGIRLIKPLDSSLTNILYILRKKTKALQILNNILYHKSPSLIYISKNLHISYPAIKKLLVQLETHLEEYGLKLNKHPIQIQGCEFSLRAFIIKFYLSIYETHWPFKNYNQKNILNYLNIFEKNLGIILFEGDKLRLAFCLCFIINRIKAKKFVCMQDIDWKLLKNTAFFDAFSQLIPKIEQEHSILFPNGEIIYFVLQLIGANYRYEDEHLAKKIMGERIRDDNSYAYSKVRLFIKCIENNLNVLLLDDDELLFYLSICFRRVMYKFKMYPSKFILHYPQTTMNSSLIVSIKDKYPEIFQIVKEQYNLFFKDFSTEVADEEIAAVTLHIQSSIMQKNVKPISIFLHVIEHPGMYRFLYAWLKKHFQNKIKIIPFTKALAKSNFETHKYKIIVTDTLLQSNTSIPIIQISGLPTKRDIKMIHNFIYSMENNNSTNV